MKVSGFLLFLLAAALAPALRAADSSTNALECKKECWDKSMSACGEGSGACKANSQSCGGGAATAESWATVALIGAAALALVGVGWYFIDKALDDESSLQAPEAFETAADLDLLPSRAALDGA